MDLRLKGKNVLVTGGSKGIGLALGMPTRSAKSSRLSEPKVSRHGASRSTSPIPPH
jgi:hypothetical protein